MKITKQSVPPDVRAAIHAFLEECQKEARPFAATEALGAIRNIFPGLDIADVELEDAITSEAATAGFDINYGSRNEPDKKTRKALERWDNEGGATAKPARSKRTALH